MKLIIITGPPAAGKMTVGQALEKITDLKLFHNHMSLELVNAFFDFGTPNFSRLDKQIRFAIFKEIANSDLEGLIFTIVWAFDYPEDEAYIDEIIQIFQPRNPIVHIVELTANLDERLKRNRHEHRLKHKASKRDIEFSEKNLLSFESEYRMNSKEGELPEKAIFKIDNTHLSPDEVALLIKKQFDL